MAWPSVVGKYGWAGVDLFFVLSGFLIASQLFKPVALGSTPSFREFFVRRSLRICPNYFSVLALYFLVPVLRERESLPPLWKFLTFTQNFGLDYLSQGTFSHAWSLCIEEQFYLVLPFLVLLMGRFRSRVPTVIVLLSLFALGFALRYFSWMKFVAPFYEGRQTKGLSRVFYEAIYYPTYNRLDGLLTGVSIALAYRFCPKMWAQLTQKGNLVLCLGVTLLTVASFLCRDQSSLSATVLGYPLVALGFGCFVISALSPTSFLSRLRLPGVQLGATLSFAFYLTHKMALHLAGQWTKQYDISGFSSFILTLVICGIVSLVLYLLIERPFLALRNRLLERVQTDTEIAAARSV